MRLYPKTHKKNMLHENVNLKLQTNVFKNIFPRHFSNFLELENLSPARKEYFKNLKANLFPAALR